MIEENNKNQNKINENSFLKKYRQQILYFSFAAVMIFLNYTIQWINEVYISVWVSNNLSHISFIQKFYLSKEPYDITELVGSIIAVGITYITKFFLDKLIVFQRKKIEFTQTSKEFIKYFGFAILTTIENLGIQFILSNFLNFPLLLSVVIALICGYTTKFLLDRKYVFSL